MNAEIMLAVANARSDLARGFEKLHQCIREYLDGYEFRGDDAGEYTPNEVERLLIDDVVAGLIAEDEFCALIAKNYERQRLIKALDSTS